MPKQYALLFLICSVTAGCGGKKVVDYGPQNTQVISSNAPESAKEPVPLSYGLDDSLSNVVNWHPLVDRELDRLSDYVERVIRKSSLKSDFVAPKLTYFGLDRESMAKTFSGNQIQVGRWRRSETDPQANPNGLDGLLGNLYEPWISSKTFRTRVTAHKITREDNQLSVLAIARTSGQLKDNVGLDSTSMWSTKFKIVSEMSGELTLTELKITAHEDVQFSVRGGTLFQEVTSGVLNPKDRSNVKGAAFEQLSHGLDEWARWIPGIDIVGNHGIAIGDCNNDGFEDVYVCQPHGLPNLLLRQNPDGTAENLLGDECLLDESRAALFVDLDNDGDQDLVVSTRRELILLSNSDGEFQLEHRLLAGYDGGSLSAADFDNDGDLDLYVCKYRSILNENDFLPEPNNYSDAMNGGRNVLLRNNEGWNFEDVTEQVGLKPENERFSRCALWSDFDLDGDQDLYVANEFSRDVLYENKDGWFGVYDPSEETLKDNTSGRSLSIGDFNTDGRPDFFVAANVSLEATRLPQVAEGLPKEVLDSLTRESRIVYSSQKEGQSFTPYRLPSPIFSSRSSNGSVNLDLNNDGLEDLIMTNGFISRNGPDAEFEWVRQLYSNEAFGAGKSETSSQRIGAVKRTLSEQIRNGSSLGGFQSNVCLLGMGQLGFANFSGGSGIDFSGDARGVATVDWDHDGDLDVVVSSRTEPRLRFFANKLESENRFVAFQLTGTDSNRDAIGARVEIYLQGRTSPILKSVAAGSGAFSQSSKVLHFGVPKDGRIEKTLVHWPSGLTQTFENVQTGRRYAINEGASEPAELSSNRFQIKYEAEDESQSVEPLKFSKSVFYPPFGLPLLEFQTDQGAWIPLKTIDRMPIFVAFVDGSEESEKILKGLAREAEVISRARVDVVAIRFEGESPDSELHFASMKELVGKTEFPFRYGAASSSMLQKLELLYSEWYAHQSLPDGPFAWLLDRHGKVRIVYPPGSVRADSVLKDLTLISGGLANTAKRASPHQGFWMGSVPTANYNRIAKRFKDLGFDGDQDRFAELSRPFLANQICRSAIELKAQGDLLAARSEFASALEFDPQCTLACVEFGRFLVEQSIGETDEVVRGSLLSEAEGLFEKAIELEPTNTDAILGRADVAKHRNKVDEAIRQLKNYLEVNPSRSEVHAIIGRLHFYQKEYVEATSHLLTAYEARPTLPFVAGDLGFLYLNGGLYEQARSFLIVANQLQPSAVDLKRHLAQAEFLTGNYESSIGLLREVVVQQPNEKMPKSLLAWLLATCPFESLRNGEESLQLATNMVKIYDDLASSHEVCAAAYAELGDFENAMAMQQKAVDLLETGTTPEAYSEAQIEGLKNRLESYKRKRPCRMDNFEQIPIRQPGT